MPPFKAENIVILTDGYCASTCTIFSELMTKQAGVKTIALGGRSNSEPIQAIGGVKGTNNFGWNYIDTLAELALSYAEGDLKQKLNETIAKTYANPIPAYRTGYGSGVNNRDGLMHNDDSGVALQFIYEEADCRLYYTPEMTVDITAVWKAAADAQWRDSGKCVGQSGYGKKREATEVTKSLKRRRLAMSQAAAQERYQALESTFGLETKCNLRADGFMQP